MISANITATTDFQRLSTLLIAAGQSSVANNAVTETVSYIQNNSTTINLHIGTGADTPTYYASVTPVSALECVAGMNANEIWLASASSTCAVDFVEGASYQPPSITGVVGTVTLLAGQIPMSDGADLVTSHLSDDGAAVTCTEPMLVSDATTPYIETASGKTNTGYVNIKGKTSGSMKFKPADATAQVVTIATAAQTSGASTLTIPDQAGVSSNFVFDTLAQNLAAKTLVSPVISTGLTASGSAANTFVGSTGTFITSSGANTLSGAVTINDAATPSLTTASGKTNTGFVTISGKTSGSMKFLPADATAQVVTISTAAQTTGACTLTITDQGGVSSDFVFTTLSQVLTNKTLTAPILNGGVALGATSTEIDRFDDVSAYQQSVVAAGALSVSKVYSGLAVVGGGAVTLAAPDGTFLGQVKTIEMTTDDGDVTLALTNVVGGSAGTTCTFNTVNGCLVLLALSSKWVVLKEFNVTLS